MKVFWKEPQRLLQLEAESSAELGVIEGLVRDGPMAGAQYLSVPEKELPFDRHPQDGMVSLVGGARVVVGCVWDVGALMHQKQVLNTQQALGQAVYEMLRLLPIKPQVSLMQPAAGVAPAEGDFEKQRSP